MTGGDGGTGPGEGWVGFQDGGWDPLCHWVMEKLDAAVGALSAAYTNGDLSAEAFSAAVAALSSGS